MSVFPNLPDYADDAALDAVVTGSDDIHLMNVLADESLQLLDRMEAEAAAKLSDPSVPSGSSALFSPPCETHPSPKNL